MRLQTFLVATVLGAVLSLAAPNCPPPQVRAGNNCALASSLGWATAGMGTESVITFYVPPSASGAIDFQVTALNSSLGNAYTGYFGFMVDIPGLGSQVVSFSDISSGDGTLVMPGQAMRFLIRQLCWDPTCAAAAPAGAVPNMFSLQFMALSPNPTDISLTPSPLLTVHFLNGSQVALGVTERAERANSPYSYIPGINLGATPATRYVYTGTEVSQPYDVLSVSNLNNAQPITGTASLQDLNGNTIATAPIPSVAPEGAVGYLLIGRAPGDPFALFPSSIVLPADSDGLFQGILVVTIKGETTDGNCIVLAQEFNGTSMLNLPVFHGSFF
jgi:hypothetical protein